GGAPFEGHPTIDRRSGKLDFRSAAQRRGVLDLSAVARFPGDVPRAPKRAPRRPPQQNRSEETIAVLLEATERVFAKEGFAQATTNRIAEVAGVSIGTLYHYFPTKEALVE